MTRARLAAVVLTAGLGLVGGCTNFSLFPNRSTTVAMPCCTTGDCPCTTGDCPCGLGVGEHFDGPILELPPPPPDGIVPLPPGPPVMQAPRLVPAPTAPVMPYTPTRIYRDRE